MSIFATATSQSLIFYLIKEKDFNAISKFRIITSLTLNCLYVLFIFIDTSYISLILSQIISQLIGLKFLFSKIKCSLKIYHAKYIKTIKKILIKYSDFPKYETPSCILYSVYSNATIVMITNYVDPQVAGLYFLAHKILQAPISLFTSAFSDVFYHKLAKINEAEKINEEVNNFSNELFSKTFPVFLVIILILQTYTKEIFGNNWSNASIFFSMISTPIYLGLLTSPYSHLLKILNKQNVSLMINLLRLVITLTLFFLYFKLKLKIIPTLTIIALINAIIHIFSSFYIDICTKNNRIKSKIQRILAFLLLTLNTIYLYEP